MPAPPLRSTHGRRHISAPNSSGAAADSSKPGATQPAGKHNASGAWHAARSTCGTAQCEAVCVQLGCGPVRAHADCTALRTCSCGSVCGFTRPRANSAGVHCDIKTVPAEACTPAGEPKLSGGRRSHCQEGLPHLAVRGTSGRVSRQAAPRCLAHCHRSVSDAAQLAERETVCCLQHAAQKLTACLCCRLCLLTQSSDSGGSHASLQQSLSALNSRWRSTAVDGFHFSTIDYLSVQIALS